MTAAVNTKLSNLQLELLQLYAQNVQENDLLAIKKLIAKYFADKAIQEMDALLLATGDAEGTLNEWANAHNRTPYQSQNQCHNSASRPHRKSRC
jgi:hypothetical protein